MTVSKSQLSLPVIEYFQSFQVGCKHLKNIIWNQIPQSPSGVHQRFIDVYDFCWGLWSLRQLRDCWLGVTLAFGWLKALLYSSLFFLLLCSGFSLLLQQHCHSSGHGTVSAQALTSGAGELDPALPLLSARWNSTKGMSPHLSELGDPPLSGTAIKPLQIPSPRLAARRDWSLCLQSRSKMSAGVLGRGFSPWLSQGAGTPATRQFGKPH